MKEKKIQAPEATAEIEQAVEQEQPEEEIIDQMAEIESAKTNQPKIFSIYDVSEIKINDPGLKRVINLEPKTMLKSHGRIKGKFASAKVNIVEKLIRILCHPGHRGKKHKVMTKTTGKYNKNAKVVIEAFSIIQEKTKENPVQVLARAIEKASPREEITTIEYGGAKYPQAVDTSPIRRVALTLKLIVQGSYDKSFNKKTKIAQALANEIILASQESGDSFAFSKKVEAEKQANSAR